MKNVVQGRSVSDEIKTLKNKLFDLRDAKARKPSPHTKNARDQPESLEAHNNKGLALADQDKLEEAAQSFVHTTENRWRNKAWLQLVQLPFTITPTMRLSSKRCAKKLQACQKTKPRLLLVSAKTLVIDPRATSTFRFAFSQHLMWLCKA